VRFSRFRRCARCEEDEDEHEVEAPLNDVVVECQKHLFPGSAGGDGPSQRARAKEEETEVEVAAEKEEEEEEKAKEKKPRRRKDEATLRIVFYRRERIKKSEDSKRRVEIFKGEEYTKNTRARVDEDDDDDDDSKSDMMHVVKVGKSSSNSRKALKMETGTNEASKNETARRARASCSLGFFSLASAKVHGVHGPFPLALIEPVGFDVVSRFAHLDV